MFVFFIFAAGVLLTAKCQSDIPAFSVARSTDLTASGPVTKVSFDIILSNSGLFNTTSNTFISPVEGTYYESLTAGVLPGLPVSMFVEDTNQLFRYIGVFNNNTVNDGQTMSSRGLFRHILAGTELQVVIDPESGLHSTAANRATAWTVFMFEEVALTYVAASVVRNETQDGFADPLTFPEVVINLGPAAGYEPWNPVTNTFTAVAPGIYFFHLSAGSSPQRDVHLHLVKTADSSVICSLTHAALSTNGHDTASRSVAIQLATNEELKLVNDFGSVLYSDSADQTSFSGFGYGIGVNADVVAFFAGMTTSWEGVATLAPVAPWDVIHVNEKNGFDPATGIFTAPLAGSYFVSFSAGADSNKAVGLSLYNEGVFMAQIDRTSTTNAGHHTISRDVVVDMIQGGRLHLEAEGGTALFSDPGLQTSFLALRLKLVGTAPGR